MRFSAFVSATVVAALIGATSPAQAQFNTERFVQNMLGVGIGIAIDQANKNSGKGTNRPDSVAPSVPSDPALAAAQDALNKLGHNAGVADGVNGRRTREAIMAFQLSLGETPTGVLTPSQTQRLHATAGSASPVQAASLSRDEVLELQRGLAAFGYDVGTPDGIIGTRTRSALADFLASRGLPPTLPLRQGYQLVSEAQPALNHAPASQLPISQSVEGVQSAHAGSGFGALNALATGQDSAEIAQSGTPQFDPGLGTGAQAAQFVPPPTNGFEPVGAEYAYKHPDILRMMIAARPSLLDDQEFLTRVFEDEGRKFTSTYRVDEELAAFKSEYLARPVPEVTYIDLSYDVSLVRSEYRRDLGLFPFFESYDPQTEKFINLDAYLDTRYSLSFPVLTLPRIAGLPMTLEEAEAFERERFKRERFFSIRIHRNVAITAIRFDEVRGEFTGDLTLFGVEATERYGDKTHLYTWALAEPTQPGAVETPGVSTLADLASVLPGIELVDGYLDIYRSSGWPHVAASLYLARNPSALSEFVETAAMGRGLLTEDEQFALWRGKVPGDWAEFSRMGGAELMQVSQIIKAEFLPQLQSRTIGPEFGIVDVIEATLSEFDPATGLVGLNYTRSESEVRTGSFSAAMSWSLGGTVIPTGLPVDQALAQKLIDVYQGDPTGQMVYVALFADVTDVAAGPERNGRFSYKADLVAKTSRVALYRDRELTDLIFDYYEDPKEWLLTQQRVSDELTRLVNIEPQNVDVMHRIAMDLSKDPTYLDDQIAHTLKESGLNEFDRIDASERLKTGLLSLEVPQPLWLAGVFSLGEYDAAAGTFAIKSMNTRYQKSALGVASDKINMTFITAPTGVSVPVDLARQFVASSDQYRKVDVRMLVTPVHASVERTRYGEVIPTITYHLERMVVLADNTALSDTNYGPYGGLSTGSAASEPTAETLPDVPLFDQELAALIAYGDGSRSLNDDEFHRMLASRWLAEQSGMTPTIGGRFFPRDTQMPALASVELYRADFENWLAAQGPFSPKKLRINVDFRDDHMAERLPQQCSEMEWGLRYVFQNQELVTSLFGAEGSNMQDLQMRFIGEGTDAKPAIIDNFLLAFPRASFANCNIGATKGIESAWEIQDDSVPQSVFVVVDKMPVPNFLQRSRFTGATIEVSVTETVTRPVPDGLPIVIIYAKLDNAQLVAASVQDNTYAILESSDFTRESLAPKQLGLDLLGIRLGMSEADADSAVRAYMADPLVLKSVVDLSPSLPAISDATIYFGADYRESISLIFEAGTGERTVLGVNRVIHAPDWGLSKSDVTASAIAKYGQPDHSDVQQFATRLGWGESTTNGYCARADDGSNIGDVWTNEAGATGRIAEFIDWNTARDRGTVYIPSPTWDADMQRCGGMLLLHHDEYRLKTFLFDPALYYAAWQRSRQMGQELIDQKVEQGGSGTIAF
jgi:peptidoglycan hydrolase-like protein with peptidoglycan-binding domain